MPVKILVLTHKVPFPLDNGGAIATNSMLNGLHQAGAEVSLICCNTVKHPVAIQTIENQFSFCKNIYSVHVDNSLRPLDAFINLFSNKSYHISRFFNDNFKEVLKNCISQNVYDWVIMDHVFLANYLPMIQQLNKGKLAIRLHNIEYTIWQQYLNNTKSILKKIYLQIQTTRLKKEELLALKQANLLLPLNPSEGKLLESINPNQYHLPITIAPKQLVSSYQPKTFFHLGSMDWLPNEEAIKWLLNDIWPNVLSQQPEFQLILGGKHFPNFLSKLNGQHNIQIHKEVSSSEHFMTQNGVLVVPLLTGSGVRVKILEALAMGIPVISTAKGAEGIQLTDKQHILIANTPLEFVTAMIDSQLQLKSIGLAGQTLFNEHYNTTKIYKHFIEFLNEKDVA
jgi:polysaccharide biosynthesis protein PslH